MTRYRPAAALLLISALACGGCKSKPAVPAQNTSQPATPSGTPAGTLNSDGTVTPAAAQPQGTSQTSAAPQTAAVPEANSAMTAQPQNQAPVPPPPPPVPVVLTAPVGTRVVVRTNATLSASRNDVGDAFNGTLGEPLVARGATLFPRGTPVSGTVVAAKGRGRFKGAGAIGIEVNTIGRTHVQTSEYEKEAKGKGKRTGGFIGGGAGLGAIIGGLAGGGKGAVIGSLAGAGAGTAGAAYTGNKDVIIPSESLITFRLTEPVSVH